MNRCTTAAERHLRRPHKTKRKTKSKPFPEEESQKAQSRVPVTALMAWPALHALAERQGAKQIAAPAEPRTPNMHRANRIAPRECGWKHGDSGYSAGEQNLVQ